MEIIVLAILILINGFFALSEIALVSSKETRLQQRKKEGSKGAKVALKLLEKSENFLSAIQVGITLIAIVTGVYGGVNIADDLAPFFRQIDFLQNYASQIALTLTVVLITYFSIVIGELVPKTVALNNPEKVAIKVAPVIYYFSSAFFPFVKLLSFSTNFINNIIGIRKQKYKMTETELRQMIRMASAEGVIEKDQNILHEKVFYFADKKAKHILTHRTDAEWIDLDKSNDEIKNELLKAGHSKLVCAHGSLDNFKGVIYLRDFYRLIAQTDEFDINTIINEPMIVPDNINATKVLELFKQKKIHLCFVVNEYGGFEGIITLHDIVETIVGQMPEAREVYDPDIYIRDDNSILVSGDAPIETLIEIIPDFAIDFDITDYSTVAGFVFFQMGKIPQIGDRFEYMNYSFEIVDVDGVRVDKILVSRL